MKYRALLVIVVSFLVVVTSGQDPKTKLQHTEVESSNVYGRSALAVPKRSEAGSWAGTWTYISRDHRFALWLAEEQGKTIAKIRYSGNGRIDEDFETDWTGSAKYTVQNLPATFDFKLGEVGPNEMTVEWTWDLDLRGSARREKANLEIFRVGDGRHLVMFFKEFERVIESGGRVMRADSPQAWTFSKRSRRLVLWEELPL